MAVLGQDWRVELPTLEVWDPSATPVWKGWHEAPASLTLSSQILSRGWETRGPQASPLRVTELHQFMPDHSSSSRKALGTEVPFSPLTTPLFQASPCGPCGHCTTPSTTRHPRNPSSACSFAGLNSAFFSVFFSSHCFPICFSVILQTLSSFPTPLHLHSRALRNPYAVFAGSSHR